MTDPSQYFRGRTVQEQMNEVIGYVDVRSAEVATDAIAADVAQVHQDMLDADADATAAAASAAAAAGTLANAVKKTGEASQSIAGDIAVAGDLTGGTVTVPTPTNNTDAASKKYVDDADALKLNITDVNSYAVGLTGNQGPIAGTKEFTNNPVCMARLANGIRIATAAEDAANTNWFQVATFKQNFKTIIEAYWRYGYFRVSLGGSNTLQMNHVIDSHTVNANTLKMCFNSVTTRWELWFKNPNGNAGNHATFMIEAADEMSSTTGAYGNIVTITSNPTPAAEPVVDSTYTVAAVVI